VNDDIFLGTVLEMSILWCGENWGGDGLVWMFLEL